MAKYKSQYNSLGFYVNGELRRFSNGEYVTTDKDAIAVLDGLKDAVRDEEPKAQTQAKAETKETTEAKPATKPTTRRASAK